MSDAMRSALVLVGSVTLRGKIAKVLRSADIDVLEAPTCEKAFDLARDRQPDLIIAHVPPAGMDDEEFALALCTDPTIRETPVVFCAEHEYDPEVRRIAAACGVSQFLTKPWEREEMLRVVAKAMGT